jgi:hypothetical protein
MMKTARSENPDLSQRDAYELASAALERYPMVVQANEWQGINFGYEGPRQNGPLTNLLKQWMNGRPKRVKGKQPLQGRVKQTPVGNANADAPKAAPAGNAPTPGPAGPAGPQKAEPVDIYSSEGPSGPGAGPANLDSLYDPQGKDEYDAQHRDPAGIPSPEMAGAQAPGQHRRYVPSGGSGTSFASLDKQAGEWSGINFGNQAPGGGGGGGGGGGQQQNNQKQDSEKQGEEPAEDAAGAGEEAAGEAAGGEAAGGAAAAGAGAAAAGEGAAGLAELAPLLLL